MNVEPKMILGPLDYACLKHFYYEQTSSIEDCRKGHEFLISSPGGEIGVMLAMYDQIRANEGNTIASGLLQSAAAVLLQAGKVRKMTRNSLLLFHEPEQINGSISDQQWTLHTHLVGLVADRTGMSIIESHDIFDGLFINPEKAKNLNLVDEIIELPVIPVYKEGYFDASQGN